MDSLTQATLGAAIGELTLGRKVGKKAALWGAIGGTLPDLDVLLSFFYDQVDILFAHRGITHSLIFALLLAPVFGYLLRRLYKNQNVTTKEWSIMMGLALGTHGLLDCFTIYGTGIFVPFSDYRVAFGNINIVDPIYTLPMLICLIIVLFINRSSTLRRNIFRSAFIWSHFYLLLTLVNMFYVQSVFTSELRQKGLSTNRLLVGPTMFNNLLWYGIAESEDGFSVGYYSILDKRDEKHSIQFQFVPKNLHLEEKATLVAKLPKIKTFTKNYYAFEERNGVVYIKDLRFGVFQRGDELMTPFLMNLNGEEYNAPWQRPSGGDEAKAMIKTIFSRMFDQSIPI